MWTKGTWDDVHPGDQVRIKGLVWKCTGRPGPGQWTLRAATPPHAERTGTPPSHAPVEYKPVGPRPDVAAEEKLIDELKRAHQILEPATGDAMEAAERTERARQGEPAPGDMSAERTALAALTGAGLKPKVIERVMTLAELESHLEETHGYVPPAPWDGPPVTMLERRTKLADLHFELHETGQRPHQAWQPRGRTPHIHTVMDRPMRARRK